MILRTAIAAAALLLGSGPLFAQGTYNAGGSPKCDGLSGLERTKCIDDESGKPDQPTNAPQSGSAGGTASEDRARGFERRYGDSPHCDTMSGAAKEQCLRDEAAKTDRGVGTPPPATR
jgi:hypothetical protein